MGAADILNHLRERGMTLSPEPGGNIRVRPGGVLTDTERAEIMANKPQLLALLMGQKTAPAPIPDSVLRLCGLDDGEIARMVDRVAMVQRHGYGLDDAEVIADRLLLRDRTGLDMHACLECACLSGRRCMARPTQPFTPGTMHELVRCPAFTPIKD